MTEAGFWLGMCRTVIPVDQTVIGNMQSQRILNEVAINTGPVGFHGLFWRFADGSSLYAYPGYEVLQAPRPC